MQKGSVSLRLDSGEFLTAKSLTMPDARIGEKAVFVVKGHIKGQILIKPERSDGDNIPIKKIIDSMVKLSKGADIPKELLGVRISSLLSGKDFVKTVLNYLNELSHYATNKDGAWSDVNRAISFMGDMKHYLQFPLIVNEQTKETAHTELYVFKRGKKPGDANQILVTLELPALGRIEATITTVDKSVSLSVLCDTDTTAKLFNEKRQSLYNAISGCGFSITSLSFHTSAAQKTQKRYTFDMRI